VGALKWWDVTQLHSVGLTVAELWPARSKPRVGLDGFGEGRAQIAFREEGNAPGWLHRAANTSRSWQWKDNGPMP